MAEQSHEAYVEEQRQHAHEFVGTPNHEHVQYSEIMAHQVGTKSLPALLEYYGYPHHSLAVLGCHEGQEARLMAYLYPKMHITVVDVVPEFVEKSSAYADEAVVADIGDLPFEDDQFDWVYTSHTIEHCKDDEKAIAETFRVARCGIAIALPLQHPSAKQKYDGHYAFHPYSNGWLQKFMAFPDWEVFQVIVEPKACNLRVIMRRIMEDENG